MSVPVLPPTGLPGNCSIIDVQYSLEFHVDPSGPSFDLVVRIPVIVGTIPLTQYIPSLAPPPALDNVAPPPSAPNLEQFK